MPARERLESDNLARCDVDDRLKVDIDGVTGDRRPQIELDQPADLDLGVHRLFERSPDPAAVRFRCVKRDVGLRQQCVRTEAVHWRRSAADAGADDHFASVDDHRPVDFVDDALRDGVGVRLARRVMVKHDKFVAAPARDQVARADDAAQPPRDLNQELIAGAMSQTVIDLLEVVEVEKQYCQAVRLRTVGMKRLREVLLEAATVGQLSDRIEAGHSVDFALRVSAFRYVLDYENGAVVLHAVDRGFDRASVLGVDRHGHGGSGVDAAEQRADRYRKLGLRQKLRPDVPAKQRMHAFAGQCDLILESEDGAKLIIRQDDTSGRVDHA